MKNLQKIMALLIVSSIVLGILTGCFEKKTEVELDGLPRLEKLDPVTLTFYMYGQENQDTKEVLNKVAEESGLNIKLDFKWLNTDYFETVKKLLDSGDNFDAFICGESEYNDFSFIDMYRNGEIKDITELLPRYAPSIYKQYSEQDIRAASVDGRLVALPSLLPSGKNISAMVRDDIREKYSISPIKNFRDYGNYLKAVKENEKDIIPARNPFSNSYDMFTTVNGYATLDKKQRLVYKWDDPEMKIIPWEQTTEFKEAVALVKDWSMKGYIEPYSNTGKDIAAFLDKNGTYFEGKLELDIFGKGENKPYQSYILYPDRKIERANPIGNINSKAAIAFNSKSKNTERALMFLNWIQSGQQNYDLFIYGIKDRHYKLDGERIIKNEGLKPEEAKYSAWYYSALLNIAFERLPGDETYKNAVSDSFNADHVNFINTKTAYAPHVGFYPDYRNIKEAADRRKDMYSHKIDDYFSNNTVEKIDVNDVIFEMTNSDTDVVVKEIQRQLDKWRAENEGN